VSKDYIARLCKNGKLKGVLEGRAWFVDTASLRDFFDRDMIGTPDVPLKIYYKDTPTIAATPVLAKQQPEHPAVLAVFPRAPQSRSIVALYESRYLYFE